MHFETAFFAALLEKIEKMYVILFSGSMGANSKRLANEGQSYGI